MGKKVNCFSAMKKALNPEAKENNKESEGKSKMKWFRKKKRSAGLIDTPAETTPTQSTTLPPPLVVPPPVVPPPPPLEPARPSAVDNEQTKHAYEVALATAKAAEAAVAAAQAAAAVVRLTETAPPFAGKSKEEIAAIRIQTAFRGYMGRRTLRALRGLVRLKAVMQGQAIKRQTASTLKSMQALARVQNQVRERRQKMAEENLAHQKLVQEKSAREHARELEKSQRNSQKNGDGWDSSRKTKEQIEAKMQYRHEAAIRRERTMAYSFTHQQAWKAASMSAHTMFMDVNNPQWGWSWLERWLAAKPWENAITPDKDTSNETSPRIKPSKTTKEITSSYAKFFQNNTKKPSPTLVPKKPRVSTSSRLSTSSATPKPNVAARKLRSTTPKSSPRVSTLGKDDDAKSTHSSMHSEQQSRRNSVTGSSVRDDESLESSQTAPHYMSPTESAKARSSPLGNQKRETSVTPDRSSVSSVKKRGSQAGSPAKSRRSISSITDANSPCDHT